MSISRPLATYPTWRAPYKTRPSRFALEILNSPSYAKPYYSIFLNLNLLQQYVLLPLSTVSAKTLLLTERPAGSVWTCVCMYVCMGSRATVVFFKKKKTIFIGFELLSLALVFFPDHNKVDVSIAHFPSLANCLKVIYRIVF